MKDRAYWLDNLRTFMIFLVVVIHVATTYERYSMGADWWLVVDASTNDFAGIVFLILNIFVMAVVFFISGYFAPLSLKSKTAWEFIRSKFKRIMIPWIIASLTVIPLFKVIFLYSRNLPQEHWTTYFHWSNGIFSQAWLWFLPVLFLFEMLYVLYSKIDTSKITIKTSLWTVFILSVIYLFSIHYFGLLGWTKNIFINFENERIFIYFLMFLLGSQFYKLKTFERFEKNKKVDTIIHCLGWLPLNLYIFGIIYALINPGNYLISRFADILLMRIFFVVSLAYLVYSSITTFRWYFNKQRKVGSELNKNSYNVYIIHVIVMGAIALLMVGTSIPSILKFFILTISTYVASNFLVSIYRRIKNNWVIRWKYQ